MDNPKISTIQTWETPRKVYDVQSFIGFANFYRRFIRNFSNIVQPLTNLTRKGVPWIWDTTCQASFDALKTAFTTAPVLCLQNQIKQNFTLLVVTCDSDTRLIRTDHSDLS